MTYSGIIPNVAADKEAKSSDLSIMSFRSNPRTQVQIYELEWEAEIGPQTWATPKPVKLTEPVSGVSPSLSLTQWLGLQIFLGGLATLKSCQDVLALHLGKCIPFRSHTHRPSHHTHSDTPSPHITLLPNHHQYLGGGDHRALQTHAFTLVWWNWQGKLI